MFFEILRAGSKIFKAEAAPVMAISALLTGALSRKVKKIL